MIVINFKNYVWGPSALDLVKKIEIYYNKAIVAVPSLDIPLIVKNTSLAVWAQHVDHAEAGRGTGFIIPEQLISLGVQGSLLNHSEHRVPLATIRKTVQRANEVGLKLIVCASSLVEVQQLIKLNPYAIAFEDKKLIATGKSITAAKAKDVQKFATMLEGSSTIPLCGAGITTCEDVAEAFVLG